MKSFIIVLLGFFILTGCDINESVRDQEDEQNQTLAKDKDKVKDKKCGKKIRYQGKDYNTVLIGDQCWLKENLNVGTRIDGIGNQTDNGGKNIIEKYCYGNSDANCDTYGGLYQWNEAMQYSSTEGSQDICPTGWHIPTYSEFQTLTDAVGGNGNALKRGDQGSGGGQGTNTSGFSALLAGNRDGDDDSDGSFHDLGSGANFWSSTESDATFANFLYLNGSVSNIYLYYDGKDYGFSVRCLKD